MKKLLVIAYYFPPMGLSGVQRTFKFVKYLPDNGWLPVVLTSDQESYYAYDHKMLGEIEGKDIRIERVRGREINKLAAGKGGSAAPNEGMKKLFNRISQTIFLPDNKREWSKKALLRGRELCKQERFDAIFVSGPPFSAAVTASRLHDEFGIPFVVDYRDLWYGMHFAVYPTPLHRWIIRRMESKVLSKSKLVTVTNPRMKQRILEYYPLVKPEKIEVVSHGFDPMDIVPARSGKKNSRKCIITYSGLFYEYITPRYFFSAFASLLKRQPSIAAGIELHFIGLFNNSNARLAESLGISNYVVQHGYQSHAKTMELIAESDILWIMVGNGRNADTISSSKLYEYFGTMKPIIACLPDSALRDDAIEYGASFITDPDDTVAIEAAILRSCQLHLCDMLPVPDPLFVERFRRDHLTKRLAKLLESPGAGNI